MKKDTKKIFLPFLFYTAMLGLSGCKESKEHICGEVLRDKLVKGVKKINKLNLGVDGMPSCAQVLKEGIQTQPVYASNLPDSLVESASGNHTSVPKKIEINIAINQKSVNESKQLSIEVANLPEKVGHVIKEKEHGVEMLGQPVVKPQIKMAKVAGHNKDVTLFPSSCLQRSPSIALNLDAKQVRHLYERSRLLDPSQYKPSPLELFSASKSSGCLKTILSQYISSVPISSSQASSHCGSSPLDLFHASKRSPYPKWPFKKYIPSFGSKPQASSQCVSSTLPPLGLDLSVFKKPRFLLVSKLPSRSSASVSPTENSKVLDGAGDHKDIKFTAC